MTQNGAWADSVRNPLSLADLDAAHPDEPRILDLRIAERLGYERPRVIRELIERNREELEGYGSLAVRHGKSRGQEFDEYRLNEAQALLICMFSKTPSAAAIRREVIEVFMAWRRGTLSCPRPPSGRLTEEDVKAHAWALTERYVARKAAKAFSRRQELEGTDGLDLALLREKRLQVEACRKTLGAQAARALAGRLGIWDAVFSSDTVVPTGPQGGTEEAGRVGAVAVFLAERCVSDPTGELGATRLYQAYESWCQRNNRPVVSVTAFGRALRTHQKARRDGRVVYQGLRLAGEARP